jgi:CAAX protease family protein
MIAETSRLPIEHLVVLLIALWSLVEARWFYPMLLRRLHRGEPGARLHIYNALIVPIWAATLLVAGIWWVRHRPWEWLRLTAGTPVQAVTGAALAAVVIGFGLLQRGQIAERPAMQDALRRQLRRFEAMIPHTPAESRMWVFVSLSAGLCEELLFRGYLIWYAGAWLPLLPAVLFSSALFAAGHAYLGRRQVVVTGIGGLAFAAIVLVSGSLWPAMLIHFALDWNSGDLGYRYIESPSSSEPASAAV